MTTANPAAGVSFVDGQPCGLPALSYKPGWSFKLGGPMGRYLCVMAVTSDSHAPTRDRHTQHMFKLPDDGFAGFREFMRWIFDCLLLCELHETGEFFAVDGFRPYYPHHGDDGSPYELVDRWETT